MKKVFIVHRWGGYPKADWYPWLKKELETKGFEVQIPQMPNAERPKIEEWVSFLQKQIKEFDKDTFFIGHSVGCQTILRFFEKVKTNSVAGGTIFVAPWTNLSEAVTTSETDYTIAKTWLETPINFRKAKAHSKKFVAIFSDNDPYVPLSESKTFEQKLGAKIIIEKNKDHYDIDSGIKELPIALNELLNM